MVALASITIAPVPIAELQTIVHTVKNRWGWVLTYRAKRVGPDYNSVVIVRRYRGNSMPDLVMSRDEAREHLRCQYAAGFEAINSI
jgi:hypothetical protein